MSKTVGIYVGHGTSLDGSWDCGCSFTKGGKKYTEAELCKPIVKAAVKYLKLSGVTYHTDYSKNQINMVAQVSKSNANKTKAHVAVHCDYKDAPSGTLPLYTSTKGRQLAAYMNKYVMKYVGIGTRGLGKRTDLYELKVTNAPAVIFEVGSIRADLETMQTKYDEYGKGIAKGICKYLGVTFKTK